MLKNQINPCSGQQWGLITKHKMGIVDVVESFGRCEKGKAFKMRDPAAIVSEYNISNVVLAIKASDENEPDGQGNEV